MTATTLLKNPFDYTSPVQSSGAYFGLSAVQKRLAGWHSPDTRISVTGSRRLGTTSTINMMAETVAEQDTSVVYLDLRLLPRPVTASSVASEILARLGYQATTGNPSRNLTQIIQSANEPVGPLVLVLDEFDLVDGADVHVLLGLLVFVLPNGIELLNRRHNAKSNTTIFIGSRRSLFDLERAVQCIDSPWYQSFRTLNLRPLDKKEATRLISESSSLGGVPLVNEAAWLIAFGGTWPFYIKLASHYAFEAKQHTHAGRLSRRDRGTVEERVWEEALPHLASYWAALSSRLDGRQLELPDDDN